MANVSAVRLDDISSPFYLHPSDGPGLVLVSQLLAEDNFASWQRAMRLALTVKNKLGFVDGSIMPPAATADDATRYAWQRSNTIVISWILNAISKSIQPSVMYSDSAKEIWDDLETRFSQTNGPRIFQLRRDIVNLAQGEQSVNVYFTRFKALWDELAQYKFRCSCEGAAEYHNTEHVMSFLMGLNDSFTAIRGQILLIDPLPNINKVFSLISQEERQRNVSSMHQDVSNQLVFASRHDQNVQPRHNQGVLHKQLNNQNYRLDQGFMAKKKEKGYCTHCNMYGHTIDRCFKVHGYPQGYKNKGKPSGGSRFSTNQVSTEGFMDPNSKGSGDQANLSMAECKQLLAFVSNQMAQAQGQGNINTSPNITEDQTHISCVTGDRVLVKMKKKMVT